MAKKRKSLNIRPEDKIVGVVPRQKVDLFAGCNEPGKNWFQRDDFEFMKIHCRICKNADCVRAKGAVSPWHTRMAEQVDYLLNDPEFSELETETHRNLAQMAFDDISQKAMRLEIARHRQDWAIPDAPSDGVDRIATPETTDQFDDAVRALAEAKGKKPPDLGRPEQADGPAHFEQADDPVVEESEWEYDTHYPSTDGKRTYHITLSKKAEWACECNAFKYKQTCKHVDTVKAWYDDQIAQGEEQERQEAEETRRRAEAAQRPQPPPQPPAPATRDPRVPDNRYNTPMPQAGVMVGGGPVPPSTPQGPPPPPPKPHDPWAPKQDRVVQPGAVVTFKEDKKDE